ncbi:MAG: hypothetical protein AB1538_14740 [Bacillota bacterium]|uniref:hypothetical protein n=1 Tax=Desulforamulus profundi TaxID=1383067 RepID=UPI000BFF9E74|nr:hypothetical protein [Desulforamulus profundi]
MLKRKLLTIGLALAVSVSLVGCNAASPGGDPGKQSAGTLEPAKPGQPETGEPGKPKEPAGPVSPDTESKGTPEAAKPDSKSANAPVEPGKPAVEGGSTSTAPKEPNAPKTPVLSKGDISIQVGASLPEFVLPDLQGKKTGASSIITQSKLTIINFWATT